MGDDLELKAHFRYDVFLAWNFCRLSFETSNTGAKRPKKKGFCNNFGPFLPYIRANNLQKLPEFPLPPASYAYVFFTYTT